MRYKSRVLLSAAFLLFLAACDDQPRQTAPGHETPDEGSVSICESRITLAILLAAEPPDRAISQGSEDQCDPEVLEEKKHGKPRHLTAGRSAARHSASRAR